MIKEEDSLNKCGQSEFLFNRFGIINEEDEYHSSFVPHKYVGYYYNY